MNMKPGVVPLVTHGKLDVSKLVVRVGGVVVAIAVVVESAGPS